MKKIGLAAIILMAMITVSGCGTGKIGDSVLSGKTLSQTEDTPWDLVIFLNYRMHKQTIIMHNWNLSNVYLNIT